MGAYSLGSQMIREIFNRNGLSNNCIYDSFQENFFGK